MNKSVKIIGIAICTGILAFTVFQIIQYYYVDSLYNQATGGHISDVSQEDINGLKELQKKSQALLDDFYNR